MVAIITGGASGLGLGLARLLAEKEYQVAIFDLNEEAGKLAAKEVSGHFYKCNVTSKEDWTKNIAAVVEQQGAPKKVFLNAGIMSRPPSASIKDNIYDWYEKGAYEKVMRVNTDGVLYGLATIHPIMKEYGGGTITVTSSLAGISGLSWDPFYSMSKHAIVGMVRSFGPFLKKDKIHINVFCPGGMVTNILPEEIKPMAKYMMTAEQAAASCFETSNKPTTGGVWMRLHPHTPLEEYVTPDVEIRAKG